MKPKQHLVSFAYSSMYLDLSTMLSFRNVSETMNRFINRTSEHRVKVSTLEDRVESQGKALKAAYMEKQLEYLNHTALTHSPASLTILLLLLPQFVIRPCLKCCLKTQYDS